MESDDCLDDTIRRDDNGRVSRLLLLLAAYHLGIDVGRYVSIERLIEDNKERYYETLEQSSQRWHEGRHDPWPYIGYLLYIIKQAYDEFKRRVGQIKAPKGEKTSLVEAAIARQTSPFTVTDIRNECPGVGVDLIRKVLGRLKGNQVECLGRGQSARGQRLHRAYIRNNPAHYDVYRYGEPRFFVGNRALLDLPMTAFLASRADGTVGDGECGVGDDGRNGPSTWPVWPECVISGFLSPMERAMFDACLSDGIPIVHILSRGLPNGFQPRAQRAIDAGRMLVMTPFDPALDRFSAARAAWCNQYALHVARDIVIGQLSSDGILACLLADLPAGKRIHVAGQSKGPFKQDRLRDACRSAVSV